MSSRLSVQHNSTRAARSKGGEGRTSHHGVRGFAMLRVHCASNRAYNLPMRAERPKLERKPEENALEDLRNVALPIEWRQLVDCGNATHSSVADGVYEIVTPHLVALDSGVMRSMAQILVQTGPEKLHKQGLTAISVFFVTYTASQSFVTSPGAVTFDKRPWAMAVDPRTAHITLRNHAEALYAVRRANCDGYQRTCDLNMRKAQGSNVRSSTHADITETTSISAETQQLLLTLQNSETLSAVLAQPPGSYPSIDPVTNADARTPSVDTSNAGKHLSVAAKFEGQSPIAASSAHAPVLKSILKSSPASSTGRDLATAELNRALYREDKLQEELGNTRKELYGALDELKAQKHQSDLARRQLEEESERKARKLEVFKHELGELKQQIEESEATKRELERKLKRQGEELDESKRTIKKIRECID